MIQLSGVPAAVRRGRIGCSGLKPAECSALRNEAPQPRSETKQGGYEYAL
jgi:hypothetical protein